MALIDKYAGGTLTVQSITLTDLNGDPILLSFFDNIFVDVFTSQSNIVKFSLLEKTGFQQLIEVTTNSFKFKVLSKYTALFNGECFMAIKGLKDNELVTLENNGVEVISLGFNFVNNYIKNRT